MQLWRALSWWVPAVVSYAVAKGTERKWMSVKSTGAKCTKGQTAFQPRTLNARFCFLTDSNPFDKCGASQPPLHYSTIMGLGWFKLPCESQWRQSIQKMCWRSWDTRIPLFKEDWKWQRNSSSGHDQMCTLGLAGWACLWKLNPIPRAYAERTWVPEDLILYRGQTWGLNEWQSRERVVPPREAINITQCGWPTSF